MKIIKAIDSGKYNKGILLLFQILCIILLFITWDNSYFIAWIMCMCSIIIISNKK